MDNVFYSWTLSLCYIELSPVSRRALTDWSLLTNSTRQDSFLEANRSPDNQEIPLILRNLKVHCRVHNSPSMVPTQVEPTTSHPVYFDIYYNITWLRHCATNRNVAGSIPDGVTGIFHRHNRFGRTMALGSTQPLTEMSTRNLSWGVKAAGA
jgi:hypothetical protein